VPLEDDVMLGVVKDGDNRSANELQVNAKGVAIPAQDPGFEDVVLRGWCTRIHESVDDLVYRNVANDR
jgi:hypothetical protein